MTFFKPLVFIFSTLPFYGNSQQPLSPLVSSFETYKKMKAATPYNIEWISLGPAVNSARAESIQAHPARPGEIYAAFGSGNLWKTVNNGLSWRPIFNDVPAQGIGDIAIAPSNPDIIYLGTGETLRKARNFTMPGTGIYKSTDAGETWQHLGLNDSWHIGEIAVHPQNPDIVVVSVLGHFWSTNINRGIYRTEDGGKNWQHVLYIDETTGANDIVISVTNPNYMYATTWEFKTEVRGDRNYNNVGANSGIYTSDDAGKTWKKAITGLPLGEKIGRTSIAVSYSNHLKAYAFIDNQHSKGLETAEIYKTIDGGSTWSRTHQDPLKILSVVNWYFTDIYVNPKDDEEIFALGVRLANSKDGGKTFTYVEGDVKHINESAAWGLHLDHCELWINPENPNHLLLANDGGVYSSYDHGSSWLHFNNIPAGEFYDITLDNQTPYNIYGGTQDDATVYGPASEFSQSLPDKWQYLWIDPWNGGDGCVTQVDPDDPNTVYYSTQNGAARRLDMKSGTSVSIRPHFHEDNKTELRYNFITPYFISPHDSKTLYHGGNYVFKSIDRGDSWNVISPDLSFTKNGQAKSVAAGALVESKLIKGLLYMGTDNGLFWVSKDDGKNWQENSVGLPNAYIRSIMPSGFKKDRVYLALTGINYDDLGSHLFVSDNYGKTWVSISEGLPDEPMNVIVEDPTNEEIIYAGGHRGVYVSFNRGGSWSVLGKNLPAVSVSDIEINEQTNDMVGATHGRGIYLLNLAPIHLAANLDQTKDRLFPLPKGVRPEFRNPGRTANLSSVEKLPMSFWLTAEKEVDLLIVDKYDSLIWSKKLNARSGLNQYRWDLITENVESDLPYFIHYKKFIDAGNYRVILSIDKKEFSEDLKIVNHK